MFFALSKITGFLLQPLSWFFLMLVIGLFYKKGKFKLRWFSVAIIMLWFFSNDFIADEAVRTLETPAKHDRLITHHKTAVILGGMSAWDEALGRVQFFSSSDRLWQGIRLLKKQKVDQLVISGGSGKLLAPEDKESKFIAFYLNEIELDSLNIYYETESRNTHENALYTKKVLEKIQDKDTVLLITSGFHMKRASACFSAVGIPHHQYITDRIVGPRKFEFDHLFIPSTGALGKWNLVIREWIGILTYRLKGYA